MFQGWEPWNTIVKNRHRMKKNATLKSTDKFSFPQEIVFRRCAEGWLVIAVSTANWIVLQSDCQRTLLEQLIQGKTIGEIALSLAASDKRMQEFKSLLAAITEREFASTNYVPRPDFHEGYRMLNLYLTNACNLHCTHCFMKSGKPLKNELPADEWQRILSEFKTEGGLSVTFSGGEPLMNKDFDAILSHASTIGLNTTILSNGVLWNKEKIEELAPNISEIQISIDGFDESSNAKIRGAGHFDRVVQNVILFANQGVRISVATTFTFQNLNDDAAVRYAQMVNTIKSQCKNSVFFKLSKKILQGRFTHYTKAENQEFYRKIMEIERNVDPNARFQNFMEGHTPNQADRNCGFGGISIGSDGEVYYCNRISEVESYGNIKGKPLSPFMKQGHQLHLQTSVDNIIPCRECHLRYICFGGCRIDDCNFQGKLIHHQGPLKQVACTKENVQQLERKMIDSYLFYYQF